MLLIVQQSLKFIGPLDDDVNDYQMLKFCLLN